MSVEYAYSAIDGMLDDPKTYAEAMRSIDSEKWQEAMETEHDALQSTGTWVLVQKPEGAHVIGSRVGVQDKEERAWRGHNL